MGTRINSIEINAVAIIDDDALVRDSYEGTVEDLGLVPVPEGGPLGSLSACVSAIKHKADAAICDYKLTAKAYSTFNGAELVASLYKRDFPAVICTTWTKASVDAMRPFRRQIASLLDAKDLNPATLRYGLESCIMEFQGNFRTVRRPWRTLVRVEDMPAEDGKVPFVYVAVPAWSADKVRLPQSVFPQDIFQKLRPGFRLHAKVNLGAVGDEDLFFDEWE